MRVWRQRDDAWPDEIAARWEQARIHVHVGAWVAAARTHVAWVSTSLFCLVTGSLFVWQRGLYLDDYANVPTAYDVSAGHWRAIDPAHWDKYYPARVIEAVIDMLFAGLLVHHELLARAVMTLFIGGNALLLGWLVFRTLGSRLAAIISGWAILAPFYAFEAVLWAGALDYPVVVMLALIFLHLTWSAFTAPRGTRRWLVLAVVCFVVILVCNAKTVAALALVPALGAVCAARGGRAVYRRTVERAMVLCGVNGALAIVVLSVLYRHSALIPERGGTVQNVGAFVRRLADLGRQLHWITVSDGWGRHIAADVFTLGLTTLAHSPGGMALLVAAGGFLAITVRTWQGDTVLEHHRPRLVGIALLVLGVLWSVCALFLPTALSAKQLLEYRMLYFPLAGVGIVFGVGTWLATRQARAARRLFWERAVLLGAGIALIANTVPLVGFSAALAARSHTDQAQIAATARAIPPQWLPRGSYLVPVGMDTGPPEARAGVGALLVGVFEASWSAEGALAVTYRRDDVHCVVMNRHGGMRFHYTDGQLRVQGTTVPVARTVLYTYYNGVALPVERLTILRPRRMPQEVRFPIVEGLRDHGLATLPRLIVRDSEAVFDPFIPVLPVLPPRFGYTEV